MSRRRSRIARNTRRLRDAVAGVDLVSDIPLEETQKLLVDWRSVYAHRLHEDTGQWTIDGFDWNALAGGYYPCWSRASALDHYRATSSNYLLVLPDHGYGEACGFTVTGHPEPMNKDLIVCPRDFSWTMAFTHEDRFGSAGPFFAIQLHTKRSRPR